MDAYSQDVEVIVRIHDPRRLKELSRAILSLVGQDYRPLRVLVVTQRFDSEALEALEVMLDRYRRLDDSVVLHVVPFSQPEPKDARAALINAGINAARGRYIALLDYDDTLYAGAYTLLVRELRASGCAIAFAGIALKSAAMDGDLALGFARRPRAPGSSVVDMFRKSFCPIHSFLLDRTRVAPADLQIDETLPIFEDYDWQMRLGARYRASYACLSQVIGDYYMKDDGSNTVRLPSTSNAERQAFWQRYEQELERRRRRLQIEPAVQRSLGLSPPRPGLTVRGLLDLLDRGEVELRPRDYLALRVIVGTTRDAAF